MTTTAKVPTIWNPHQPPKRSWQQRQRCGGICDIDELIGADIEAGHGPRVAMKMTSAQASLPPPLSSDSCVGALVMSTGSVRSL
jgi:hypothetical protein